METTPNDGLRLDDIPGPEADWYTIGTFALTFNGYEECGSFEECARIANEARPTTLTELRACLFFEQRRWRHFGDEPDEEDMTYIKGLVEQISTKVAAGDLV